jgi:hypothetical protein
MRRMLDEHQLKRLREQVKARNQIADERQVKLIELKRGHYLGRWFRARARRAADARRRKAAHYESTPDTKRTRRSAYRRDPRALNVRPQPGK